MRLRKFVLAALLIASAGGASVGLYPIATATAAPTLLTTCTTIVGSGSYKLANNLFSNFDNDCLRINQGVMNVTIDLDGFTIQCVTEALFCTTGIGIRVVDVIEGLTVRNGTVKGFRFGLHLYGNSIIIERMHLIRNTDQGLLAVESIRLIDNLFIGNGFGAQVGEGSVITGNEFSFNTTHGLRAGVGSTVVNNVARRNGGTGIRVACPSAVVGNTATANTGANLVLADNATRPCAAENNVPAPAP